MVERYPSDCVGQSNLYWVAIATITFIIGWVIARTVEPVSVKEYWECRQTGNCIKQYQSAGSTYLETRGK